eukprot:gene1-1_t
MSVKLSHSFRQRSIAWVLLLSWFLQNCVNPSLDLISPKEKKIVNENTDQRLIASIESNQKDTLASVEETIKAAQLELSKLSDQPILPTKSALPAPVKSLYGLSFSGNSPEDKKRPLTINVPVISVPGSQEEPGCQQTTTSLDKILTADGYQVQFLHQDNCWKAQVQGSWTGGRGRGFLVPVYMDSGMQLGRLSHDACGLLKRRVHVLFDRTLTSGKVPMGVYVGMMGLLGGAKTLLHEKMEQGDVEEVMTLLSNSNYGTVLHSQDEVGATLVHRAVVCKIKSHERGFASWYLGLCDNPSSGLLHQKFSYQGPSSKVRYTHEEVLDFLVKIGASMDAKDYQGQTPLHWVVHHMQGIERANTRLTGEPNYPAIVRKLLALGASINSQDKQGYTPLHYAVEKNNLDVVLLLVGLGANTRYQDHVGNTPLHLAVRTGNVEMIEYLTYKDVKASMVRNNECYTPLHMAVVKGKTKVAQKLLEINPYSDYSCQDASGNLAFHLAIMAGNRELMWSMVDRANNRQPYGNDGGVWKEFEHLLKKKSPSLAKSPVILKMTMLNKEGLSPIDLASIHGHLDYVEELLKRQPKALNFINSNDGLNHLHRAVLRKDVALVKTLLHLGASKDLQQGIPLFYDYTPVKQLPPKLYKTALHMAVEVESPEIVRCLVEAGANMNIIDNMGKIPLDDVLEKSNKPIFRSLLSAFGAPTLQALFLNATVSKNLVLLKELITIGVDINTTDQMGITALHYAVLAGDEEIVKFLLSKGACQNYKDNNQMVPLYIAIRKGHIHLVNLLIAGAGKDSQDVDGNTALHVAALSRKVEVIKKLVALGADINIKNKQGLMPIHLMTSQDSPSLTPQLIAALGLSETDKMAHLNIALHNAILAGSLYLTQQLIGLGADVNAKDILGRHPLHVAIQHGYAKMVCPLLSAGAHIEATDSAGNTALHLAVRKGDLEAVAFLMSHKAEQQVKNKKGETPLYLAIIHEHVAISEELLKLFNIKLTRNDLQENSLLHQAISVGDLLLVKEILRDQAGYKIDINAQNFFKKTPLHLAASLGNEEIIAALLAVAVTPCQQDAHGNTPLHCAVQQGHQKVVEMFMCLPRVEEMVSIKNDQGYTLLHEAVEQENVAIVTLLVAFYKKQGIKLPNSNEILRLAVTKSNAAIVAQLLSVGAYSDEKNQTGITTPLHLAIQMNHIEIVEHLVAAGASLYATNETDLTPLELASEKRQIAILQTLLKNSQQINQLGPSGLSHLHRAIKRKDLSLVTALVQHQASVKLTDDHGQTPLHHAASQGSLEILQELAAALPPITPLQTIFSRQSTIDLQDHQHQTPLHQAIAGGHVAVVTWLLGQKADLYHKDKFGKTPLQLALEAKEKSVLHALVTLPDHSPLHCAVDRGDMDFIQELMAVGVDINTIDLSGKSPLYKAFEREDRQMIQQLVAVGARVDAASSNGRTLLHQAAIQGKVSLIKTFLDAGIDIQSPDKAGKTPLHLAIIHGQEAAVIFLIQAGANLYALDAQGYTPLSYPLSEGNLTLVENFSRVHEYKLQAQRCAKRAEPKFIQQQDAYEHTDIEKKDVPLVKFIARTVPILSEATRAHWQQEIIPSLNKTLLQAPVVQQKKMIRYFETGGGIYPTILENYPPENWLIASLKLDLAKEATTKEGALDYARFNEVLQAATASYNQHELEVFLTLLREKQMAYGLNITCLSEAITYFAHFRPNQAVKYLAIPDAGWFDSLRLAWMKRKTQPFHFSFMECRQLAYAMSLLPYEGVVCEELLKGCIQSQEFQEVRQFLGFLVKNKVSDSLLMQACYKPSLAAHKSLLKNWKYYISCELLKNTLKQRYVSEDAHLLAKQLVTLLEDKEELYEPLQATLQLLSNKNIQTTDALTSLLRVTELMNEYRLSPAICKDILLQINSIHYGSWEQLAHSLALQVTFGASSERGAEEIMDFMAAHAPNTSFVKDRKTLKRAYQAVEDAYKNPSKLYTSKKKIAQWEIEEVKAWAQQVKEIGALQKMTDDVQQEAIAVIEKTVELVYGYKPRATQRLALLAFLNHAPGKGRLAQINTGEGKSLIVAMLAAVHALSGTKVDVVTTSSELSVPEVTKQRPFFSLLGLSLGENSTLEESAKKEIYTCDIVYGTAANFQGDILRTEFSGKNIRGNRNFGVVIVDEVDSMLFDSRQASIRLSSQTPAMSHLERLLAATYQHVHQILRHMVEKDGKTYYIPQEFEVNGDQLTTFSGEQLQMMPVEDKAALVSSLTEQHLGKLLRDLQGEELKDRKSYNSQEEEKTRISFQAAQKANEAERKALLAECDKIENALDTHPWHKHYPVIDIPPHLKDFARKQIPAWTRHAIEAICYYKKKFHYDVVDDRIVPIDYANTGVFQQLMVWSDGLAQMLQMKEGLPIHPENISTNFISIPGYFQRYGKKIYGLTGTLGNAATHAFLKETYGADLLVLPPYKHMPIIGNEASKYLCKELPAIITTDQKSWQEAMLRTTLSKVKNGRAVLIICKYVKEVSQLAEELALYHDPNKIFTYTGEGNFHKDHIEIGEVIIATNIAGRGTDITTSEALETKGGLHVCITFLPDNYRVELQNAGRTARQGKQGTAQLVIHDPKGRTIETLRTLRDEEEARAIQKAQGDIADMLFKDQLFRHFCAVESKLLSSATHAARYAELELLWKVFHQSHVPIKLDKAYEHAILQKAKGLLLTRIKAYVSSDQLEAMDQQIEHLKAELYLKYDKATFIKEKEDQRREQICALAKGKYAPDIIEHFRQGHVHLGEGNAAPKALVADGKYERMALEEAWGLWLHHVGKDMQDQAQVNASFQAFVATMENLFKDNALIQNPYYYILQGNYLVAKGEYTAAVKAYDKAINLDPINSVHAHYNKALALLKPKDNKHNWQEAEHALEQAKLLLAMYHKPYLISLNAMVGNTDSKPALLEHFQHQFDIIIKQESYIDAALKEIRTAREKKWDLEVSELKTLNQVFDDASAGRTSAITKASIHGLDHLFVLKAKEPYPWKSIIALACLSAAQLIAGVLITAYTGGLLGSGLISEGVSDLLAGIKA